MHQFRQLAIPALLLSAFLAPAAYAAGTTAGTDITNTATVTYVDPNGDPQSENSNTSTFKVDEILNVTVTQNNPGNVTVLTPDSDAVLSFTVTNTGNGNETYALAVASALTNDQFDPTNVRVYIDNGDGFFDVNTDTLFVPGANDPTLAPDGSVTVFVVSDIPAGLANGNLGNVRLNAEAVTVQSTMGSDAPGTVFAGQGDGGVDAVVGNTGAEAFGQNGYIVQELSTSFVKTQVVSNPNNPAFGAHPVPGATITYTLTFTANGVGTLAGVFIEDEIPANTTYKPGSLTINAGSVTDAQDGDAGYVQGRFVRVLPNGNGGVVGSGSVVAPEITTITFQVTIN
ncbi:MAG: hypothetical protein Q8J78_16625 [Moraxellaceae bacterium]|nr:hypothetical protein [Moraxellaceae bacterium]